LAAPQGFEPRYADPESAVLPLNEGAAGGYRKLLALVVLILGAVRAGVNWTAMVCWFTLPKHGTLSHTKPHFRRFSYGYASFAQCVAHADALLPTIGVRCLND
jgi:hypothetical protein